MRVSVSVLKELVGAAGVVSLMSLLSFPPPAAAQTARTAAATANTFTDPRDGKTYRTASIGNMTWMAQNLNFETDSSKCYYRSSDSCANYGIRYTHSIYDVCPKGWRLPSFNDWRMLIDAIRTDSTDSIIYFPFTALRENDWNTLTNLLEFPVPSEKSNWDNYYRYHPGFWTVGYDTTYVLHGPSTVHRAARWVSWTRTDGNEFRLDGALNMQGGYCIRCVKDIHKPKQN